jgi:hypothetical protein
VGNLMRPTTKAIALGKKTDSLLDMGHS